MQKSASSEHAAALKRLRTFEPPPSGFDPQTAPDRLLRQHGFPRRPDPKTEPNLMRIWQRAFARCPRLRMTKAELKIDPIMSGRDPLRHRKPDFSPAGWGGIVVPVASLGF